MNRTLFPFQAEGAKWLAERSSALLFDDPGLGKTTQAIASWPQQVSAVVVCPAVVKGVWEREIRLMRPDLTTRVLSGRNGLRPFQWPGPNEVIILNYDILPDKITVTRPPYPINLIADEAHYLKNVTAKRSLHFRHLAYMVRTAQGKVHGLSATPLTSWPQDLWGVHRALHLETAIWGSYATFVRLFHGRKSKWGMKWGLPDKSVPSLMAPYCLGRKRETVLPQLPTKVLTKVMVDIRNPPDEISEEAIESCIEAVNPVLATARKNLAMAKAHAMRELIEIWLSEGPLVVFSAHVDPLYRIAQMAGDCDKTAKMITGEVESNHRSTIVQRFQDGEIDLICGSIGAMGVGVTLTRAHRVVFLDRSWTPSENIQAEDRVCRIGQTRGVEVIDIVANNPIDERVFRLLQRKSRIINASVEEARAV